jgi:radical SAM protein with 4Fe4S-binding SPASM domain
MGIEGPYVPVRCVWELTLRCNMRCLHCGSRAGKARADELSLEECFRVGDDLAALGCQQVTFIGGEVFLYPGWEQVARRLAGAGVAVNIITNGFLMGDRQIEQIRQARLANVGISLDGMEENHNRIRRVPSSFRKTLEAFERLKQEGISTGAVTSLLSFNVGDLEAMYQLLVSYGVELWQLQIATAMGNLADGTPLLLPPEELPRITAFIIDKLCEGKIRVYAGDDIGYYDANEPCIRTPVGVIALWQGCQAGLRVVGIDSVGNVKGCESLYSDVFIEGNLRQESLSQIWNRPDAFAYNRQFEPGMLTGACARCDKGPCCRAGCRGMCYFSTGRLYEDPYCCYPGRVQ